MEPVKVFIVNLGKYNEGEDAGEWFTLPVSMGEVKEKLGLNEIYEEYAIHDYYNWPLGETPEYVSVEELNRMALLIGGLDDKYIPILPQMVERWGSLEEACERYEDVVFYDGCDDMSDVAACLVEECGLLDGIPDDISRYFDFAAYGRDLEINGCFVRTADGYAELPG